MTVVGKKMDGKSSRRKKNRTTRERFLRERLFGQIALKAGKITQKKLQEVLLYQQELKKRGIEKKTGDILVKIKAIAVHEIAEILKKQEAMDAMRTRKFQQGKKRQGSSGKALSSLVKKYRKGEVIFRENDDSTHDLYVIQSGEIGVYKNSIHLGKRFERGAFLGTTSCLLKIPRIATAVAMKDSTLLKIPENGVQTFFARNPQMALKLSSVLAKRVSQITEKYVELAQERPDAAEKLHDALLIDSAESESIDDSEKDTAVFEEPLISNGESNADQSRIDAVQNEIAGHEEPVESLVKHEEEAEEEIGYIEVAEQDEAARDNKNSISSSEESAAQGDDQCLDLNESDPDESEDESEGGSELLESDDVDEVALVGHDAEDESDAAGDDADGCDPGTMVDTGNEYAGSGIFAPPYVVKEPELDENGIPVPVDPAAEVVIPANTEVEIPQGDLKSVISGESPLEFSAEIRKVLDVRLGMYVELENIAKRRDELESKSSTSDRAKNELSSLRRELNKIPPYPQLKMKRDKLAEMVAAAENDGAEGAASALSKDVVEAYEISVAQKTQLVNWYDTMPDVINTCSKAGVGQLMYKVMLRVGVNPSEVFGWAVYVMAMNEYLEELKNEQKELKDALKEIEERQNERKGGGLMSLFKKKPEVDEEEVEEEEKQREELEEKELVCRVKSNGIMKEISQVEPVMVNAFWAVYGAFGLKLVNGVEEGCERYVRGYLRWGILGCAQDFIKGDILEKLLAECDEKNDITSFDMNSDYILYADEVIEQTAKKILLPSPDEDLEMNERNSPRWKVDRAHRKIVGGEYYLGILKDLQGVLEGIVDENVKKREEKEKELEAVAEDDPDRKIKVKTLKKAVQNYKITAIKSEKLVEKARDEMAGKIQADIESGKEALTELGMEPQPEDLARHEIKCIRRFSRLVAKLQEPFLPFTLKDRFDPEMKTTNTRADMTAVLKDIEEKDPLIFKENMLSSMKKNNRVQIRTSPFIHLLPASGIMGFVMAPRIDTYCGKIMLPGYFERSGMREAIAVESFSDFRYDTSKEQAGNDVMNSDTLVAAYAEVRWILRKKDKDVRQKAGIFTDENERTNWRRHYAMYINSAYDSGKQLFFKCPDLYELIINKFIELPEGVEILSRG